MGATVDVVSIYTTTTDDSMAPKLVEALESKAVDMVTFTSSSTVKNFKALLPNDPAAVAKLLEGVTIASIGPITTETAIAEGLTVHISAAEYTIQGLCDAILGFYA